MGISKLETAQKTIAPVRLPTFNHTLVISITLLLPGILYRQLTDQFFRTLVRVARELDSMRACCHHSRYALAPSTRYEHRTCR